MNRSKVISNSQQGSNSQLSIDTKGHHRRTSSLWVPPSRPIFSSPTQVIREKAETGGRILKRHRLTRWIFGQGPDLPRCRIITPNNQAEPPPRYLHRTANLYFIFIVVLNMVIGAFGKYISLLPISFVLGITAIKDAFEVNTIWVFREMNCFTFQYLKNKTNCFMYRKLEWQNILVGDFVHLSHDEIIPADILLLRSSDVNGLCYVDTCNLDGESNLKQRQAIRAMGKFHSPTVPLEFSPDQFNYKVSRKYFRTYFLLNIAALQVNCEEPTTDVYKFEGRLETMDGGMQLILILKLYYSYIKFYFINIFHILKFKRSTLERLTNVDIIWCVVILLALCITGAVLSGVWMRSYPDPYDVPFFTWSELPEGDKFRPAYESFFNFWSFIIVLQVTILQRYRYQQILLNSVTGTWRNVLILFIMIVVLKVETFILRVLFKRWYFRALNIPEELGQIEYVMSDKTGTLTENQMVFRRCSVTGRDFGGHSVAGDQSSHLSKPRPSKDRALENFLSCTVREADFDNPIFAFFVTMAICNTVVVNAKPHEDLMDPDGDIINHRCADEVETNEKSLSSHLSVKFLEEVEEETSSNDRLDSPRESIELIEFEDKPDNIEVFMFYFSNFGNLQIVLFHRAIMEVLIVFDKYFSRSVDKRQSQSSQEVPPLHSYYDSESPDELALVEAAREYGIRLLGRHFDEVIVYLRASAQSVKYKILHTLPFDADRKRMSVVVRECYGQKRVILFTKGADATVLPILETKFVSSVEGEDTVFKVQKHLSDYAREGLRTLCLARKFWSESEYQIWRAQHEEAEIDPHHRENLLQDSTHRAETDVELLAECIHSLREAGIRVWVLTGDKIETAVNIAYSSR
uniref:P-type phospholipid transporter n=1 Tax=Heterorhabditis bacteriophora TaxID=37862 RepID=A0A1I7WC53_HETBA